LGRRRRSFSCTSRRKKKKNLDDTWDGPILTYKQFLETQESVSPNEGEERYEKYKTEYKKKQLEKFFNAHKEEEWFKERYEPNFLEKRRSDKIEQAKATAEKFTQEFINLKINLSESEYSNMKMDATTSLTLTTSVNEEKPDTEKLEQETEAVASESIEKSTEEKPQNGDLATSSTDIKPPLDTKSILPIQKDKVSITLFIKTIPPHVSRTELRTLLESIPGCKLTKLFLSEPQRYKNFP